MTRAEKLLFLCAAPHRKGETLKIIFNDAAELQVQQVYTDTSGALRIKTISAAQEELKRMFSDQTKTKKMIVQERGQTLAVYDNYTQLDGIMAYTAGSLNRFCTKLVIHRKNGCRNSVKRMLRFCSK